MNSRQIQSAARGFVQAMKDDARQKLQQFLNDTGITVRRMARDLDLNEDELNRILEGDGNVSLVTFATLLIANGLVLEVKDIRDAPIPTRNGVPIPPNGFDEEFDDEFDDDFGSEGDLDDFNDDDDEELDGFEDDEVMPHVCHRHHPGGFFENIHKPCEEVKNTQPRDSRGRFMSKKKVECDAAAPKTPDFKNMNRSELVEIIQNKLWDSEINVEDSSKARLVEFLEEKDRKLKALLKKREEKHDTKVEDPYVLELKEKVKESIKKNPNLRDLLEELLG